eukprot:CAMPEP_0181066508 /NCGR_PEP_ID=MMETSP1070-20121207/25368_1 /TAXON_ID=265543 /ORGANISM="Minutocellus polymorphus, Strain NH13" /LENGTH=68 /DNA_ID=CAMNT_0023147087 /DNA_START=13 /DNA_END=219 /DNA_ORIENTATION=-
MTCRQTEHLFSSSAASLSMPQFVFHHHAYDVVIADTVCGSGGGSGSGSAIHVFRTCRRGQHKAKVLLC